ncbi:hypothetical protein A9977_12100 [Variovorax sp. UMC13]|nr:hypothetical protein [Variovorax sp. UMC13]
MYLLTLRRSEPLTAAQIGELAGASHPTVAYVLKLMEQQGAIHRANGLVRFDRFQIFPWTRWLNLEVGTRKKVSFVDISGHARSPESMVRRLAKLNRADVAVGGLLGAKHYFPSLDMAGTTRLDLVVHGTPSRSLSFIDELDPALAPSKEANARASVVVHFLPRAEPFFEQDQEGNRWADPIVCMSDLQEAGFDQQAEDLLQNLAFNRA